MQLMLVWNSDVLRQGYLVHGWLVQNNGVHSCWTYLWHPPPAICIHKMMGHMQSDVMRHLHQFKMKYCKWNCTLMFLSVVETWPQQPVLTMQMAEMLDHGAGFALHWLQ